MNENIFKIGQLVCSKSGRDRGNFYLVFEIIDDRFVYLVDGNKRKMENPKKKNVKHLRGFPAVAEELAERWEAGQLVSNSDVRKVIAFLRKPYVDKDSETRG